ncbi:cation:proton antiporter domain-containing protein, partial [Klebsiella pneumoniae]|uniref:cation:proton antiporter domain-containing protein n=1 Tax=Klebsiella pneumoniae TaxID=573 RepID=UPI003EE2039F
MVRLGQPAIIGQIVAGVLLGQTVFGNLFPDLSSLLFPQDNLQSKLISCVSWIGVSFLLMLTGMETDT